MSTGGRQRRETRCALFDDLVAFLAFPPLPRSLPATQAPQSHKRHSAHTTNPRARSQRVPFIARAAISPDHVSRHPHLCPSSPLECRVPF